MKTNVHHEIREIQQHLFMKLDNSNSASINKTQEETHTRIQFKQEMPKYPLNDSVNWWG